MTDMEELMKIYQTTLEKLELRHAELTGQIYQYDKRITLLEQEIDELQEVMCMMRPYLRGA